MCSSWVREARVGCSETVGVATALVQVSSGSLDQVEETPAAEGGWKHVSAVPRCNQGGRGGDQGGSWGSA